MSSYSLVRTLNQLVSKQSRLPSSYLLARQRLSTTAETEETKKSDAAPQQSSEDEVVKKLQETIKKNESSIEDLKDKYLRAMAEAENTRLRMQKQVQDAKIFGIQGFCKDLLEVADILRLAIENTDPAKSADGDLKQATVSELVEKLKGMHKGLVMTETCLIKVFAKNNLVQIEPAKGETFDPNLHDAIFQLKDPEQKPGTVSVIVKRGFKLNDRVVRAAQVGVVQQ